MVRPIPSHRLAFGRAQRKNPTVWEGALWEHLKEKNLGVRFKRQVYIGGYIVDICCASKKLVIELDGSRHNTEYRKIADAKRSKFLQGEGYKILRFWNYEIEKDINKVLEQIIKAIS